VNSAPLDVIELLRVLDRHRVKFVVIGGVAVQAHGHRRTTMDLDLIPEPEAGNYERLAHALTELDARPRDIPGARSPSAEQLPAAAVAPPLVTRHGELHLLNDVPGAAAFEELRRRALLLEVDGLKLAIAGRDDLIAMKRASGRPVDLEDIAVLTA
jgi:predicted nucleotidyltransferase